MFINRTVRPALELHTLYEIELPPHLHMNIRVLQDGKLLAQGRDLVALKEQWAAAGQQQVQHLTHKAYQRSGIQQWDFGDLPESIQTDAGGLPVRAFPCLRVQGNTLELTVDASLASARESHRAGVRRLIRNSLPELERLFKQSIQKTLGNRWLLAKGLSNQTDITADLLEAAFQLTFVPLDEPLPLTEAEFRQRLQRRADFMPQVEKLLQEYAGWLDVRHKILKAMSGSVSLDRALACSDAKAHLERLMARGFMLLHPWAQLQCFSRYLKGIEYRLDKLQGNLPRDRQSMIEFDSLWQPYQDAVKKAGSTSDPLLQEFGWLLEEWRVGLFAQPLGTREPVSLKRLEKRWQEIRAGNN